MSAELHLRIAGVLQLGLALLHLAFPKRFDWARELPRLSLLNRQMFVVHTAFIAVVVAMFGALSLLAPQALLEESVLSRLVLGGLAAFWTLRLVVQCCVFDSRLWRGHALHTAIHILFTAAWLYLGGVYAAILLLRR
ncbi:MAG TPA: hypothetical protein VK824_10005 [Planctomycetota bacterium]|nr:hypothetical protein [Planctomycetota bacterium]